MGTRPQAEQDALPLLLDRNSGFNRTDVHRDMVADGFTLKYNALLIHARECVK
jgi:hypothetical protein